MTTTPTGESKGFFQAPILSNDDQAWLQLVLTNAKKGGKEQRVALRMLAEKASDNKALASIVTELNAVIGKKSSGNLEALKESVISMLGSQGLLPSPANLHPRTITPFPFNSSSQSLDD